MFESMRRGAERFGYLALLTACGALALGESLRIMNTFDAASFLAGPGGYVMLLGAALLCFALIELAAQLRKTLRRRGAAPARQSDPPNGPGELGQRRNMYLTYGLCVVYVLLIQPLGFSLASLAYLAANLILLGNGRLVTSATLAVIFAVLYFGVPAMGLYLPKGPLGF